MDRAHKFLDSVADHALKLMEKEAHKLHPKEIDYIAAICDLHNEVCEFVEIIEKRDGIYEAEHHKWSKPGEHDMWDNPAGNPRKRRGR